MQKARKTLLNEFLPVRAMEILREISLFHRAKGSKDYSRAVNLIKKDLAETEILKFKTEEIYGGWQTPESFSVKDGYLRYSSNGEYITARLDHSPIGAIFLSDSTDGIKEFEVYHAGKGEQPEDYDDYTPGQAVLASGQITKVYNQAVIKRDAPCIISSYMRMENEKISRTPEEMPDAVNYTSFPSNQEKSAIGFTISWREYKKLKNRIKEGVTKVEAYLKTGHKTDNLEILTARSGQKNTNKKPILLTAHLCHPKPGANDNASGAALLAEITRVLQKVNPEREIYSLWIPEMFGTAALLDTGWFNKDFELAVNFDMVGADQAQTGSTMNIFSTPWSVPSFLSELMAERLASPDFRWKQNSYAGGTDHFILANPQVGIPAISLTQQPDRYYHTNQDTADKCSIKTLDWVGKSVLNLIYDLIEPEQKVISATAGRILNNYYKDLGQTENELTKKYLNYLTYQKLIKLKEYGEIGPAENWLKDQLGDFQLPEFRADFRKISGPIANSHLDIEDNIELINWRDKFDNWGVFQDELINFLELGFNKNQAILLAGEEFNLPEDIAEYAEQFLNKAISNNLIKDLQ
ncbi:MAG: DUF4910 domain-containing protein [Bacillota bacterium]